MNDANSLLELTAGYIVDLWSKLRDQLCVPQFRMDLKNLRVVQQRTGVSSNIEVGSYNWVTTNLFSYLFSEVHTLEIDPALPEHAERRCASRDNVDLILGDGAEALNRLASEARRCACFLDGYLSGGETSINEQPESLLVELDALHDHMVNFDVFDIDDFRLLNFEAGSLPKSAVLERADRLFSWLNWDICVHNNPTMTLRRGSRAVSNGQ